MKRSALLVLVLLSGFAIAQPSPAIPNPISPPISSFDGDPFGAPRGYDPFGSIAPPQAVPAPVKLDPKVLNISTTHLPPDQAAIASAILGVLNQDKAFTRKPAVAIETLAEGVPVPPQAPRPEKAEPEAPERTPVPVPGETNKVSAASATYTMSEEDKAEAVLTGKQLSYDIRTGNWKGLRKKLAELPTPLADVIYNNILSKTATAWIPLGEFMDFAEASPSPLIGARINSLATILKKSFEQTGSQETFIKNLEKGNQRIGGSGPITRLVAGRLLVKAAYYRYATNFLPPVDDAIADKNASLLNLHARHQSGLGRLPAKPGEPDPKEANQLAWDLTREVVNAKDAPKEETAAAYQRVSALLPLVEDSSRRAWLEDLYKNDPTRGYKVLGGIVNNLNSSFTRNDSNGRITALKSQDFAVRVLLDTVGEDPGTASGSWPQALRWMAPGWINEAQKALGGEFRTMRVTRDSNIRALTAQQLIDVLPDPRWIALIAKEDKDTSVHMEQLVSHLLVRNGDESAKERIHELAKSSPSVAAKLAKGYFEHWVGRNNLSTSSSSSSSRGIPLTRSSQVRKLEELGAILREFEELGLPPMDPAVLASAFDKLHSVAEIYTREEIENCFGPTDQMDPELLKAIATEKRKHLAGRWRKPATQQQLKTQRSNEQLTAEVVTAYEEMADWLGTASTASPKDWNLPLLLAQVQFDQAEFLYGQEAELAVYTAIRDAAFGSFDEAAKRYEAWFPNQPPTVRNAAVYNAWFNAALGASDLGYLTRQDEADLDQIDKMRARITGLEAEENDFHMGVFAWAVQTAAQRVPPQLKVRYLSEALRVFGEHEKGSMVRNVVQRYEDLLHELELHVAIDGPNEVGNDQPFGVMVSIRSTTALGRESKGFSHILSKGYNQSGGPDQRTRLEQEIREAWGESFEVDEIIIHQTGLDARQYGRPGWYETPMAYAVLRSKDPSIDKLPAIQVDMLFDQQSSSRSGYHVNGRYFSGSSSSSGASAGSVMLPIESEVTLLDARSDDPPVRPGGSLTVMQTLDSRQWADGKLTMDIFASGKGLVPPLSQLLDLDTLSGWTIDEQTDNGLSVIAVDTKGDQPQPVSERRWNLRFSGNPNEDTQFKFPPTADMVVTNKYRTFDLADIVDSEAEVALPDVEAATSRGPLAWLVPLLGLALAIGLLLWFLRSRGGSSDAEHTQHYEVPDELTPFRAIALLRRISDDESLRLSDSQRNELGETIQHLETAHFARNAAAEVSDLKSMVSPWVKLARGRVA